MKLNDNGKKRIQEMIDSAFEACPDDAKGVSVLAKKYLTECDDFELEPTDFDNVVVSTPIEHYDLRVSIWNAYGWLKANESQLSLINLKEAIRKSEKIAQQSGSVFEPEKLELYEEDAINPICFTLKEVKEILQSSYDVFSYSNCPCIHQDNALKVQALLKGKIEEAESKSLILKE